MGGDGIPIYWTGGGWDQEAGKVADDYADFFDGDWDDEENPSYSFGNLVRSDGQLEVWTGTRPDGTEFAGFRLGVNAAEGAAIGRPGSTAAGAGPISSGSKGLRPLSTVLPLYGISPLFLVQGDRHLASPRNVKGAVNPENRLLLTWETPLGFTETDIDYEVAWRNPSKDFAWELLETVTGISTSYLDPGGFNRIYGVRAIHTDGRKSAFVRYFCSERTGCQGIPSPEPPVIDPLVPVPSINGYDCKRVGEGNSFVCRPR